MNLRIAQRPRRAGMGNLLTRTLKATFYETWKATSPSGAAQLEAYIAAMPAEARWIANGREIQATIVRTDADTAAQMGEHLNAMETFLRSFDGEVRRAAAAARDDGWELTVTETSVSRGLGELVLVIAVVVVAVGAAWIVAAYLAQAFGAYTTAITAQANHKASVNALVAARRADLVPTINQGGGGSNFGDQIAKGAGSIMLLGAAGILGFMFLKSRRASSK